MYSTQIGTSPRTLLRICILALAISAVSALVMHVARCTIFERLAKNTTTECEDFVQSPQFKGARRGFVFRIGDSGVGYYRDFNTRRSSSAPSGQAGSRGQV